MAASQLRPAKYNERRGDHVWTEGDRKSPVPAMRLDYWHYEPLGRKPLNPTKEETRNEHR
jgi:hypothetical protein